MVCTDGKANCGVGNVDSSEGAKFYGSIANISREKAASISVITMEGEDCSMENLGTAADVTSGQVEIVDPLQLSTKVVSLLSKSLVANSMMCTVIAKDIFTFKNEANDIFKCTRDVGNVTDETDISFAFEINQKGKSLIQQWKDQKSKEESTSNEPDFIDTLREKGANFQIQLKFIQSDGSKVTKIITLNKPITTDRIISENDVDSTVVALQAIHSSARMAQKGNYQEARINLVSTQRLLQRGMKTSKNQKDYLSYIVQAEKLDQFMREAQQQESVFGASSQKQRDDTAAKAMYQMKSVSVKMFNERK